MLLALNDADYDWLTGDQPGREGLRVVAGGVAPLEVLAMLRAVQAGLAASIAHPLAWMIVEQGEVVGMINLVARDAEGRFELGYGMAAAAHGRGTMTRAIGELLPILAVIGLTEVTANTAVDNPASQKVIENNGFIRIGMKVDPEDGPLIQWAARLS